MKNFKISLSLILCLFMLSACQKDSLEIPEEKAENEKLVLDASLELTDEVLSSLKTNYYNTDEVSVIDFHLPDGSIQKRYRLEGDVAITKEQMEAIADFDAKSSKNYHTYNLVSPRTLTIIGYTGGNFALSNKERQALQWAVNNYNRLNLGISFDLSFGTNFGDKDMVVYNNSINTPSSDQGGSAGFPSNGNPNKFVQIYNMSGFSTNANEHVLTHEIGHSVGFRHSDWDTRRSCGQSGEPRDPIGAVPIPGTPSGYDSTSLMLACFSASTSGEFNDNDIIALNYLY